MCKTLYYYLPVCKLERERERERERGLEGEDEVMVGGMVIQGWVCEGDGGSLFVGEGGN